MLTFIHVKPGCQTLSSHNDMWKMWWCPIQSPYSFFHSWKYNQLKGREQYDGQSGNACEKVCEKHVCKKTCQALSLSYFHIILLNKL